MLIDLLNIRDISYRINDVDNIKQIEYIISFPSGYKHSFPVHLDRITGEVLINLPALKGTIQFEYDGIGYIKITKLDGTIKEYCTEPIRFIEAEILNMNPIKNPELIIKDIEPINSMALKTNEVVVSHSNTLQFIMSNVNRNKK